MGTIEAMKQALEALETPKPLDDYPPILNAYAKTINNAITSLRQAIAELESKEPIYQYQLASGAWIDQTKESHDYNVRHGQATVRVLYTHPPQRTWVGLTDEEICMFSMWLDSKPDATVFTAIEAKLKEKNT